MGIIQRICNSAVKLKAQQTNPIQAAFTAVEAGISDRWAWDMSICSIKSLIKSSGKI